MNNKTFSSKIEDLRSEGEIGICEFKNIDFGLNTSILFEFPSGDNNSSVTISGKITFDFTLSYVYRHFDFYDSSTVGDSYNKVIVVEDSELIKELTATRKDSKEAPRFDFVPMHFRLLFEKGPCIDVVANTYTIEYEKK
jgi:hypothetical protein